MNSLISVLMPVFNAEEYLDISISSILNQTYKNFEFIIINDGSTDSSLEIIKKYQNLDVRLRVISRENRGLIASLNEGLSISTGGWICRMDADDISLPDRLSKQVNYAEENKLDICGSWAETFGSEVKLIKPCSNPFDIEINLLFRCPIVHPSVIMRKEFVKNLKYSEKFKHAEDYKFWVDVAQCKGRLGNIPEKLLLYRLHSKQISHVHSEEQLKKTKEIKQQYWMYFLGQISCVKLEYIRLISQMDRLINHKNHGVDEFFTIYKAIDTKFKKFYLREIVRLYLKQALIEKKLICPFLHFLFKVRNWSSFYLIILLYFYQIIPLELRLKVINKLRKLIY